MFSNENTKKDESGQNSGIINLTALNKNVNSKFKIVGATITDFTVQNQLEKLNTEIASLKKETLEKDQIISNMKAQANQNERTQQEMNLRSLNKTNKELNSINVNLKNENYNLKTQVGSLMMEKNLTVNTTKQKDNEIERLKTKIKTITYEAKNEAKKSELQIKTLNETISKLQKQLEEKDLNNGNSNNTSPNPNPFLALYSLASFATSSAPVSPQINTVPTSPQNSSDPCAETKNLAHVAKKIKLGDD